MNLNTPVRSDIPESTRADSNADRWNLYRESFTKLIAATVRQKEARPRIVAGEFSMDVRLKENGAVESAVVRLECVRRAYSRDVPAGALSGPAESFDSGPDNAGARGPSIDRVAELLSDCRGEGRGASADDRKAAERIVRSAAAQFRERQGS